MTEADHYLCADRLQEHARAGCGGSEDDLRMFVTAWRRLESARVTGPTLGPGFLASSPRSLPDHSAWRRSG
jgi:hypothetical protein